MSQRLVMSGATVPARFSRMATAAASLLAIAFTCVAPALAQTSVTNTATITAPTNVSDPDLTNNSASDTDTVTPRSLTLTKIWTDALAGNAVSLTISAAAVDINGAVAGSSIAPATTVNATANLRVGSTVTLTEAFTAGLPANYSTALTCTKDTGGAVVPVTGTGLSGTVTMPGDSNVTCTFTNSRSSQTLQVVKAWVNAVAGHTATVTTTGGTNNSTFNATAPATGLNGTTVNVFTGDVVTLPAETFGGGALAANYDTTLVCAGGSPLASGPVARNVTITNSATPTVCTYTNTRRTANLVLRKSWVDALVGEIVDFTATGSVTSPIALNSVAQTATEIDAAPAQTVFAGETLTLAEAFAVPANAANYATTLQCTGTSGLSGNTLVVGAADANIQCTLTNTRRQSTLRLFKNWAANSRNGDIATLGASSGLLSNTSAFTSTASVSANSNTVPVFAGEQAVLPAETMSGAALANYDVALACSGGSLSGTDGKLANTLTVLDSDQGNPITCTYTNTRRSTTLQLSKTWLNGFPGDSIIISASGLAPLNSVAAGGASQTDTGAAQAVFAGDVINLTESVTSVTSNLYDTTLSCTNTTGLVPGGTPTAGVLTIGPGDSSPIVCTYVNNRRSAQLVIRKVWAGASPGASVNIDPTTGFANNAPALASTFPGPDQTAPVTVYAFETGTLGAETFTSGNAADYSQTRNCDGTDANLSDGLTISIADAGNTITCTYFNTFVQRAELNLTKTSTVTSVTAAGDDIPYALTATNSGNVPLSNVTITDPLVSNLVCIPATPVASLAVGASISCTGSYTVTQADINRVGSGDGTDDAVIRNTATAAGTPPSGPAVSDSASVDVNLPALSTAGSFTKTPSLADANGSGQASVGEVISYSFTVMNAGNTTLSNIVIVDPLLPALSCGPSGDIQPGQSRTFGTAPPAVVACTGNTYVVTQADLDNRGGGDGDIDNTATATGNGPGGGTASVIASGSVPLDPPAPRLVLDKTASPGSVDSAGDVITYTFTVTNPGNVTVTGIDITDPLPGLGAITCTPAAPFDLAPGASATCTADYTVTQADIDNLGSITNTATAEGEFNGGPVSDDDSASVGINPGTVELSLDKTADRTFVAGVGEVITYSFRVSNPSTKTFTGVLLTGDTLLGAGLSCAPIPLLLPGASVSFNCTGNTYSVTQADIDLQGLPIAGSTVVSNTATVRGSYLDAGLPAFDEASDTVNVQLPPRAPGIFLTKISDVAAITAPNQAITYTFEVRNTGNVTLTNVAISDPMLPALNCPVLATLPPSATATLVSGCTGNQFTVTQNEIDTGSTGLLPGNGQINNIASVTSLDPLGAAVGDVDENEVTLPARSSGMTLVKSANVASISTPGTLEYTFTVANTGSVTINNLTVTDPSIGLSCPSISLAPATSLSFGGAGADVVCTNTSRSVTQAEIDTLTSIDNTATAAGSTLAGGPIARTSNLSVPINRNPALTLAKVADRATVSLPGDVINYTITATNIGNVTLANVVVGDALLGTLTCTPPVPLAAMAPGAAIVCTGSYAATQADFDTNGGGDQDIDNTAIATWIGGNATASTSVGIPLASQSLTIDKTAGAPTVNLGLDPTFTDAGDTLTYTFVVTNTGNQSLSALAITDVNLDAAAVCDKTVITASGPDQTATCTGIRTLTQVDLDNGSISNSATAQGTPPASARISSAADTTTTPLPPVAVLVLDKAASPPTTAGGSLPAVTDAGDTITFSFRLTNSGNVSLSNLSVTDPLPGLPAVTCPVLTLAPGASVDCSTAVYMLTQADMDAGVIANSATAGGRPPSGPAIASPPDGTSTPLASVPGISLDKTAGIPSGNTAGSTIVYSFLVRNTGNVTLTGLLITDPQLAAAASCPATTLAPGANTTCTGTHTITQAEVDAGVVNNTATATGTPPSGPPLESAPDSTTTPIASAPALTVDKTAGVPSGNTAGSTIAYSFLVRNTGNVTLTGIAITDPQLDAAAICAATTLAPTVTTTCTGTRTITQADVDAGVVNNSATAAGAPPTGAAVTSPPDTTATPITATPSLTVDKSAGVPSGNTAGSTIAYSFLVTNTGNVTLTGLVINDPLLDSAAACAATTLAPAATTTCTGTHTITQVEVDAGAVNNSATASGTPPTGPAITSPPDTTSTPLASAPALTVDKTAGTPSGNTAGSTIAYSFLVTNTGNVTLTGIAITDPQLDAAATCAATTLAPALTTTCTGTHTITQAEVDAGVVNNSATAGGTPPTGPAIVSPPDVTSTPLAATPLLSVVKASITTALTAVGQSVPYTYLVTNAGNVSITVLAVADDRIATVTCPVTALAPGANTTCTGSYVVTQADLDAGGVTNIATATGTPAQGTLAPATATLTIVATTTPLLTVVKASTTTALTAAGQSVPYTYVVTNAGNVGISAIAVADDRIATVTCPVTALAPGASTTCTGSYVVTQADLDAGGVTNIATVTGTPAQGTLAPATATLTIAATAAPALTVDKVAGTPSGNTAGSTIAYSFLVTNTGNVTLTGIAITDPQLDGAAVCGATTLAPAATTSCTGTRTITQADVDAGVVNNSATAGGTPPSGPAIISPPDTTSTPVVATPLLAIVKASTTTALTAVGQSVPYTYLVSNAGNVSITALAVADDRIATVTCPVTALAPGASTTCTASYTVTQADLDAGGVTNIATATGTPAQGTLAPATATLTLAATAAPALTVDKTAGAPSGNTAGSTIAYSFLVTNTGNVTLTGIAITDPQLDAAATCAATTLAPASTTSCTATHTITQAEVDAGVVNNSATASGTPPIGPAVTSPPDTTSTPLAATPLLTIVKASTTTELTAVGQSVPSTYLVSNAGNVTVSAPAVSDDRIATVTCPVATLAPGASTTCTGSYTVTQADLDAGGVTNIATATGTPAQGTLAPATATLTIAATATPLLTVVKASTPTALTAAGQSVPYTYLATNTGNVSITALAVADDRIATVTCPVTALAPGASTTCTGSYTVTQADLDAGGVTNIATATGTPAQGTLAPATATLTIASNAAPALTVDKTAGTPSGNTAGSTIAYSFLVTNTGNVTLTGIAITDPQLDAAATCAATTLAPASTTTCTGTRTITQAEVDAGVVNNSATAGATPPTGPVVTSPPDTTVTPLAPAPALTVVKTAGTPSGNTAGSTIAYSFLVTNTGNVTLIGIAITDPKLDAPATCAATTLAPATTTTCTGTRTLTQADVDAGSVTNTATAGGSTPGGAPVVSPPSTAVTPIPAAPALSVSKTAALTTDNDTPGLGNAGDVITYSVQVTNTGNVTLTAVEVRDSFQGGPATLLSCAPTTLAPGQVANCAAYTYTITDADVTAGGSLENTVTAKGTANLAGAVVVVEADAVASVALDDTPSDMRVSKSANPRDVRTADLVRYTVTIENRGVNAIVDATLVDTPPAGFSYVDGSLAVDDADAAGRLVGTSPLRVDQIDIAAGDRATVVYLLRVGAGVRPGVHVNSARAEDGSAVSNVATAEVVLVGEPLLDEALVLGTVFDDRNGNGAQDTAALDRVQLTGGFSASAYVANSTRINRGQGEQPEPDASAPMLHGLSLGSVSARQSDADPASAHQVVISQTLSRLDFSDDLVLSAAGGVQLRMNAAGETTVQGGDSGALPTLERRVSQVQGGYRVDYVLRNEGVAERGVPGVRIATVDGLLVETDAYGRFSLQGVEVGSSGRGSNFIMKVDPVTLPPGTEFTTDNPLVRRVTPGLPVRMDFGAKLPPGRVGGGSRVQEIEIGAIFFQPESAKVRPAYAPVVTKMAEQVRAHPDTEIVIAASGETSALAYDRAKAVQAALQAVLTADEAKALRVSLRGDLANPDSTLLSLGLQPALGEVLFDTDQATLRPEFAPVIARLADDIERWVASGKRAVISVVGHADRRGAKVHNDALGLRRAKAVYDAIAAQLAPEARAALRVEISADPAAPVAQPGGTP